jgi:hypothetical protein
MGTASSAYMVQFSDGSLRNQLVSRKQLLLAMRVGLLFFDEAYVSAPALIRNDVLFELSSADREAMRSVYRSFIRPLTLAEGVNISDVAQAVVNSDLKIGFNRDKRYCSPIISKDDFDKYDRDALLEHAEFIKDARPRYKVAASRFRQSDFGKRLITTMERIASNPRINDAHLLYGDLAKRLEALRKENENFRVIDAVRVFDVARDEIAHFPDEMYRSAYSLAFLTMEWLATGNLTPILSSSQTASRFVDEVAKTSSDRYVDLSRPVVRGHDHQEFMVEFPVGKLLSIPLADYIELRDSKPFRRVRQTLAKFRATAHPLDGAKAQEAFAASGALLADYVVGGKYRRINLLQNSQSNWDHIRLTYAFSSGGIALSVAALALGTFADPSKTLSTAGYAAAGASSLVHLGNFISARLARSVATRKALAEKSQAENYITQDDETVTWDAVSGRPIRESSSSL